MVAAIKTIIISSYNRRKSY